MKTSNNHKCENNIKKKKWEWHKDKWYNGYISNFKQNSVYKYFIKKQSVQLTIIRGKMKYDYQVHWMKNILME